MRRRRQKKRDPQACKVYGLMDYRGRVGYVGQTRMSLEKRLEWHFHAAVKGKTRLHYWIRKSMGVEIFLIDGNATWDVSEILAIDRYRREGHELMNVLRGGSDSLAAVKREGRYTPI